MIAQWDILGKGRKIHNFLLQKSFQTPNTSYVRGISTYQDVCVSVCVVTFLDQSILVKTLFIVFNCKPLYSNS